MTARDDDRIVDIQRTSQFEKWLRGLRDRRALQRITDRLKRFASGATGDTKSVGDDVHELRFAFGPGYRIYYMWRGSTLVLLLIGGDKDSQARDIAKAKELAKEANDGLEDDTL
ncbi:type II toxin-antitoxin system RelE/ParE family toxin [Sphingopyxis sp.]|uniref:type II toxin-antitoxin system RelE/ParE family toxin n=1 Tax=Sphingopyxis sp. TaxID=1908224 RepID=UPI002B49691F|nr:type II toxin-antitoxin system RelE/ParE family toxin [Sphingopyxis sp.]HJS12763.1 type II toxin-antitoxin system RelE/ParE family toxin [Sphingopyxis sp.]